MGAFLGGDLARSNPCNCKSKQVTRGSGELYHGRKVLFLLQGDVFKMPDPSQDQQLPQPPEEMHSGAGKAAPQLVFGHDPCHPAPNCYGHYYTGTLLQGYHYGGQNVSDANDQTYNYWDHSSVGYPSSYGYEQSYYAYGNPHTNGGFEGVGGSMPVSLLCAVWESGPEVSAAWLLTLSDTTKWSCCSKYLCRAVGIWHQFICPQHRR